MKLREAEDLEPWEVAVAKTCVQDFLGQGNCIAGMEFDDLYQECILHWLGKKREFRIDARQPAKAFMATVVKNKLKDLLRGQGRTKRGAGYTLVSLDEPLYDDSGDILADVVSDPAATRAFDAERRQSNLDKAMLRLTDRQRELCFMLANGYKVTEAAEYLEVSRPTVYAEIKRIRRIFEDEGLQESLP
jgi:RNA polymerase sigma factor (sigma-70 family)